MKKNILKLSAIFMMIISCLFVITACSNDTDTQTLIVNTENAKTTYDLVDDFTVDGLKVFLEVSNERTEVTKYEVDSSNFKKGEIGTYKIIISYQAFTTDYNVEVKEKGTLEIAQNGTFFKGQTFSSNAPVLINRTSDNKETQVEDYEVIDFDSSVVGEHTAEIKANGFNYEVDYTVVEHLDYVKDLVNNVLMLTQESEIYDYFSGHKFTGDEYLTEYGETVEIYYDKEENYCYGNYLPINGGYYEVKIDKNGLVKIVDSYDYSNVKETTEQYASQEEAIVKKNYGTPYQEYMEFVNTAKAGIDAGLVSKVEMTTDGNIIVFDIYAVGFTSDGERYPIRYKVYYDAQTKTIKEVYTYVDNNENWNNHDQYNRK